MILGQHFTCAFMPFFCGMCLFSVGCGESAKEQAEREYEKSQAQLRQSQADDQARIDARKGTGKKEDAAAPTPPSMPPAMANLNPQQQGQYITLGREIAGRDWTKINFSDFTLGPEELYDALLPEIEQSFTNGPEFNTENVLKEIAKRDPFARDLTGFRLTYGPSLAVAERMNLNPREKFELLLMVKKGRQDDFNSLMMTMGALLDGKPLPDHVTERLVKSPLTRRSAKAAIK